MARHFTKKNTSWQKVAPWYNKLTKGGEGHYFHQRLIIPNVIRLLKLQSGSNLLDLACGNGVLAKALPKQVKYLGVDLSEDLIKTAQKEDKNYQHRYLVGDVTAPLTIPNNFTPIKSGFTHAAIILALQNLQRPEGMIKNVSEHLVSGGKFIMVLNHPAFRIPRQTSWGIDEEKKTQYRRIDRYMSPLTIPINTNPSDRNSERTWSYHFPLSSYSKMLHDSGFMIDIIEEWTSDKDSEGRASKMENRSRSEIPLFMAIVAKKS